MHRLFLASAWREEMPCFQTQQELEDFLGTINQDYRPYGARLWKMGVNDTEILAYSSKEQLRSAGIPAFRATHLTARCQALGMPCLRSKLGGELDFLCRHCSAQMK